MKCLACDDTAGFARTIPTSLRIAHRPVPAAVPVRLAFDMTPTPPTSRRGRRKGSSRMESNGRWSRCFDDPIALPLGRALATLRDAAQDFTALHRRRATNKRRPQAASQFNPDDGSGRHQFWLRLASIRHEANTSKAEARSLARLD